MRITMITCLLLMRMITATAQESLLKDVEDSVPARQKVIAAFKSTRVINAHSMEMLAKGNLDFRILHRFGQLNSGIKQWYGLDEASMRMAFDYGITDNVSIGIGRSTLRKEVDGFVKARLLQQTTGPSAIPLTVVLAVGTTIWTEDIEILDPAGKSTEPDIADRTAHYAQLVLGRKFSENFSLQLSPILLHRNLVKQFAGEKNTIIALGGGARYKVSKRVAFTVDYHHPLDGVMSDVTDPLSVGVDIETGGHVFQLHFSNSPGMNERAYLTQTTEKFFNGDIRFGFNLSRIFKVGKRNNY